MNISISEEIKQQTTVYIDMILGYIDVTADIIADVTEYVHSFIQELKDKSLKRKISGLRRGFVEPKFESE